MLLNTHMNANIHLVMNSFGSLFHYKIFSPDISLTCFKFPDISRFSRQAVTLCKKSQSLQFYWTLKNIGAVSLFAFGVLLKQNGLHLKGLLHWENSPAASFAWSSSVRPSWDFTCTQEAQTQLYW